MGYYLIFHLTYFDLLVEATLGSIPLMYSGDWFMLSFSTDCAIYHLALGIVDSCSAVCYPTAAVVVCLFHFRQGDGHKVVVLHNVCWSLSIKGNRQRSEAIAMK